MRWCSCRRDPFLQGHQEVERHMTDDESVENSNSNSSETSEKF